MVLGVGEQGGLVLLGEEVTAFGEQGRVEGVERGNLLGLLGVNWEGRREAGGVVSLAIVFLAVLAGLRISVWAVCRFGCDM